MNIPPAIRQFHLAFKTKHPAEDHGILMEQFLASIRKYDSAYIDKQKGGRGNFFLQPVVPKNFQNQYGGNVGRPIRKNKLFFFGGYEGMKQRQTYSSTLTVATPDARQGNFSASGTTLHDPTTGTETGTGRTVFSGGIIPASRLNRS
jgi:hypothetical protein